MSNETITITLSECAHFGDMDYYLDDIVESGGKVLESCIDYDAETGAVTITTLDRGAFIKTLNTTKSAGFASVGDSQ